MHHRSTLRGTAGQRENEAFAAVFRATVDAPDPAEAVQRATEALHPIFPTSLIAVWLLNGDRHVHLLGLQLPEDATAAVGDALRAGLGSVSLDDDLAVPRSMRRQKKVRLRPGEASIHPRVLPLIRDLHATEALVMPIVLEGQSVGCAVITTQEPGGICAEDEEILDSVLCHLVLLYQSMRLKDRDGDLLRELRVLGRAVQRMPHPLKVFTPEWRVRYVNSAFEEVLGYAADEVHGWHASVFRASDSGYPSQREIEEITRREGIWDGEVLDRHKDGRVVPMRVTVVPVYDAEGWVTDIFELEQDLTRERAQARSAAEAYRLAGVGQLAASVAHEVNNPLASIAGLAELLLDQGLGDDVKEDLLLIREEARRAGSIVQNLLAFARRGEPNKVELLIPDAVKNVLDLQRQTLRVSNIRVETDYAPELPWILGDTQQLRQVLHNLVRNAAQAIAECASSGVICIRAHPRNGNVELVVEDTGPGIAPEVRERIFEPFFTTKEIGRGTGLGLSVTAGIVRDHGGEIEAENWGSPPAEDGRVGEGGARIILRLPIATNGEPPHPVAEEELATPAPTSRRVLVIEDEAGVARMMEKVLERLGYESVICTNGEDALRLVDSGRPFDAVVVDLQMPGMGGAGFYRGLRESRPELVERLIFASGDVASATTHEFLRETGRPVLAKPFPLTELREAITQVVEAGDA